jgi:hypothetical protein
LCVLLPASSIYVSEEIKTLDLSLPKYDSINTLKSSADSERGLGFEDVPEPRSKASPARKAKSSTDGGGGGGNPLASVLPSMNKSVGKKPKPQKSEKPVQREKDVEDVKYKIVDTSLPSYSESTEGKGKSAFAL